MRLSDAIHMSRLKIAADTILRIFEINIYDSCSVGILVLAIAKLCFVLQIISHARSCP